MSPADRAKQFMPFAALKGLPSPLESEFIKRGFMFGKVLFSAKAKNDS